MRKLMSLVKRGKGREMGTGLGRSPRGLGPRRRGVADPRKKGLAERTETANENSLAKAEGGQPWAVPECQCRRGPSGGIGWNGLVRTGRSVEEVNFLACMIHYSGGLGKS